MPKTTIVIPNYNGIKYLEACLASMRRQTASDFRVIVVDNASTDGSREIPARLFPEFDVIYLPENTGFTGAVNAGIKAAEDSEYVLLLNNDTVAGRHFTEYLEAAMDRSPQAFSAQGLLLNMKEPEYADDAGDFYCALGWGFARGKDRKKYRYTKTDRIFYACAGAAIYRMSVIRKIGAFDDRMFAYLEDADIGWRARLAGYENLFVPKAQVLHAGSGSSGSRYNEFKIKYSSRNNVYIICKNMPKAQILFNLPLLSAGFLAKIVFFEKKGFGRLYRKGLLEGFRMGLPYLTGKKQAPYKADLRTCLRLEAEMLRGILLRFRG